MSPAATTLTVVACGMVTGVGYNAPATLAALRARVSGVRAETWPDFESGMQVRCARVSFPQRHGGTALLADLVTPAIAECFTSAGLSDTARVPLLIGVARPDRPGRPQDLEASLVQQIYGRLDAAPCRESRIHAGDQAGCAFALLHAQQLIEAGVAEHVLIAGVDTLLDRPTINAYSARRRLLTPRNFNGFLPGEAGAAVLIGAAPGNEGGLRISGIGYAQESATIEATKPMRATGLTNAIRAALQSARISMPEISFRVTDLSGEHYKFKEAMLAAVRLDQVPRARPLPLWHPVEFLGEVGAAILPCILAWTWHALRHGYAPGRNALCHLGSDDGHRFAFVAQPSNRLLKLNL
jgi:3-oxoacyl-[acyl-carrier-protein] synthase-1